MYMRRRVGENGRFSIRRSDSSRSCAQVENLQQDTRKHAAYDLRLVEKAGLSMWVSLLSAALERILDGWRVYSTKRSWEEHG